MTTINYTPQHITADELNAAVEFDCPFEVLADSTVIRSLQHYAPNMTHVEGAPAGEDIELDDNSWTIEPGNSGQQGYTGPVMHASEQLSGSLAERILSTPGVYVVCAVEVVDEDGYTEDTPAGWAVARYTA